jgi:PTS system ascorbate-specific IIA component
MSVGLLLVTHNDLGAILLETATKMLASCPLPTGTLGVHEASDPDLLSQQSQRMVEKLDQGDGVLVLTDMYGSTPANIATRLRQENRVAVVAGVNLPMLVRAFNYSHLDLPGLTEKVLNGGREGVMECSRCDRG